MIDPRPISELVPAAAAGDRAAWDAIVERYAGLVVGVIRGYRLDDADLADVSQTVWLRLVESLGSLREPRALPGWLVTTARNESVRTLRLKRRTVPIDPVDGEDVLGGGRDHQPDGGVHLRLVEDERREAVREALATMPEHCRALLGLLVADPPLSYDEISARLAIPRGSIGPTRGRCLDKMRRCPALAALLASGAVQQPGGPGQTTGQTTGQTPGTTPGTTTGTTSGTVPGMRRRSDDDAIGA